MSLMQHLTTGEEVLARVGAFYATNRRVLKYERTPAGKETAEGFPYSRLRSVEVFRPGNHRLMIGGTLLVLLGLFSGLYVGLYTPFLAVPVGAGFILFGARGTEVYYLLRIEGETAGKQQQWRIPYHGSMEFIAAVSDRSGQRPKE